MTAAAISDPSALVEMTVDLVSSYVANNSINAADLPKLIASVFAAMESLGKPDPAPEPEKQLPAIPIKKSVTDDFLISLEDGKPYKSLKRHLRGLGLTPDQYRQKWGLPLTYPTVAPNYAKQRSELAHALGLGQQRRKRQAKELPPQAGNTDAEPAAPRKRGRPKKA
jgi:predicted transcriptional regulator